MFVNAKNRKVLNVRGVMCFEIKDTFISFIKYVQWNSRVRILNKFKGLCLRPSLSDFLYFERLLCGGYVSNPILIFFNFSLLCFCFILLLICKPLCKALLINQLCWSSCLLHNSFEIFGGYILKKGAVSSRGKVCSLCNLSRSTCWWFASDLNHWNAPVTQQTEQTTYWSPLAACHQ